MLFWDAGDPAAPGLRPAGALRGGSAQSRRRVGALFSDSHTRKEGLCELPTLSRVCGTVPGAEAGSVLVEQIREE